MKSSVHAELRADERYDLALPITINGEEGQTLDLSAHGILFESTARPALGSVVSLALTYRTSGEADWHIECEGEVVRVECYGESCNIAVRLRSPLFR